MIQSRMRDDLGLETLLDLNGSIIDQSNGYWIKIEAWRVATDDNAHAVKLPKKFKYVGRRLSFDHKHRHVSDKGVP